MFSKLFGGGKPKPDEFERLLAQARRCLWRDERENARQAFQKLAEKIKAQLPKNGSDSELLRGLYSQARLGVWAIRYLDDPSQRSLVRDILDHDNLNSDTAYFIARVFLSRDDLSPEALIAYRRLLQRQRSPQIARRISGPLCDAPFSTEAYELLQLVVDIEPSDLDSAGRLCRWHLKSGDHHKASELASQIMQREPEHIDGNRTLAVLAEVNGNWEISARHYRATGDYLRSAVVAAKAGNLTESIEALALAEESSGNSYTWLYYRGWVAFQQEDFVSAVEYWKRLRARYPQHSNKLDESLEAAQSQWLYAQLQLFRTDDTLDPLMLSSSVNQSTCALQQGAVTLMLHDEYERSRALLRFAAEARQNDITSMSYLLLEYALRKDDLATDALVLSQLFKQHQDVSLFLWLRGLMMLRNRQSNGQIYLKKAYQQGVAERHLPLEAIHSAAWLVAHLNHDEAIDITGGELDKQQLRDMMVNYGLGNRFLSAIVPAYTLNEIAHGRAINWLDDNWVKGIELKSWHKVLAAYFVASKDWSNGLGHLSDDDVTLKTRVIFMALEHALKDRNVVDAARYVRIGLDLCPGDQEFTRLKQILEPQMQQVLWEDGELEKLDFELEKLVRSNNATTAVYHDLALVYTRLAIQKDVRASRPRNDGTVLAFSQEEHRTPAVYTSFLQDQAHNDYWLLAIGYWAVALSDETYWINWAEKRRPIYEEAITIEQIRRLIQHELPRLLRVHHEEWALAGNQFATHHRYYASIIEREIELTGAIRYLIRVADHQSFALPTCIRQFISPLLVKEYGYGHQAFEAVKETYQLRLSPYEVGLIRDAFSPLSDVRALSSVENYEIALLTVRKLIASPKHTDIRNQLRQELHHLLELAAKQQIELENWGEAMRLAAEARSLQPSDVQTEQLHAKAAMGYANTKIKIGDYSEAIQTLENMRSGLNRPYPELDTLASETYVEWGNEAIRDDDVDSAKEYYGRALEINRSNTRATRGLAGLYHDQAIGEMEAHHLNGALVSAERALAYHDNPLTNRLLAIILHDLGVQASNTNAWTARDYYRRAFEHARIQCDQEPTEKNLHFYVEIGSAYVLHLYTEKAYSEAIRIGEDLLKWRIDHSTTNINLPRLMSAVYTDHGAILYNSGNRWQAKQLMQKALDCDPTNTVARKNLYLP